MKRECNYPKRLSPLFSLAQFSSFNSFACTGTSDNEEDLDLLLADYESDDESGSASRHAGGDNEEDADDTVIRVSRLVLLCVRFIRTGCERCFYTVCTLIFLFYIRTSIDNNMVTHY